MKSIFFNYKTTDEHAEKMYQQYPIKYETPYSSGFDLRANCYIDYKNNMKKSILKDEDRIGDIDSFVLEPNQRCLIGTGIISEFEQGFELQIRSRSGLSIKHGVIVLNGVGTIDQDYKGELCAMLYNSDTKPFKITKADRICQGILCQVFHAKLSTTNQKTDRGDGGFGSTGMK